MLAAGPAHAQDFPLTIQLDWKPTAQFAGILVAKDRGFYRQAGLDVTILPTDAEMATVAIVSAGKASIGVTEADVALVGRAHGAPIKAFATMMQATPFCLITLKQSGLATIKSLKGKRIGLHGDGEKSIDVPLRFNGMTRQDVTLIDVPYTLDDLIAGKVDAMQGYSVDEAVRLETHGYPVNIIPFSENGYASYAEVLFARSAFVDRHPEQLLAFLKATRAGWNYAIAHPDETARMIVRRYLPEGSVDEQRRSLAQVIPLLDSETGDRRFGWMRKQTWDQSTAMFNRYQLVDRPVDASELVDYSIIEKLYPSH